MKAFIVEKYGKSGLHAADVPVPTIGPRDVLVRVRAASINPLDKMVRNGEFKRLLKYKRPFVLGHDVSGVVTQSGTTSGITRSATRSTPDPATYVLARSPSTSPSTLPTSRSSRTHSRWRSRQRSRWWRLPRGRRWSTSRG